jgi:methylglutaconyl-CoA hydratase
MKLPSFQTLKVDLDPRGVLTVSLNRPEVRNAFNDVMIPELHTVFSKYVPEPEVRAVVLRGEGPVFSAGGDLNWMKKAVNYDFNENLRDTTELTRMFVTLNECPKPVIGAFHGAAIGGGVGLVSVCDRVVASSECQFSLSEVRLGIVPACIGPFVVAKIGPSHARSLFMTGERILAARAREIGLIHDVVEKPEDIRTAVEKILENVLQCGPNAMAHAKKLVLNLSWAEKRAGLGDPYEYVARMLAELRVTPEGQEGVRAFLEKRKPSWLGKG